jgi:hypothetical protein
VRKERERKVEEKGREGRGDKNLKGEGKWEEK